MDRLKTEAKDDEAQISMFPLGSTDLYQAQTSVDNQGSAGPARAEASSSLSEESSAEEVQVQRQAQCQADGHGILSLDQAETSPADSSEPILVEQGNHVSTGHLESLLAEAKEFYKSARPPFVSPKRPRHRLAGVKKTYLLATKDGKCPLPNARKIEIVYSFWDNDSVYATMDLNGSREIVYAKPGSYIRDDGRDGRGGAQLKIWLGIEQGFSKIPVAFPLPGSSAQRAVKRTAASADSEATSNGPSPKRILRASKPIRFINWTGDPDDTRERSLRPRVPRKAINIDATTESELESSSDSDADHDSELVSQQEKGSVNKSPALPTPGASLPRTLPSYDDDSGDQIDTNCRDSPPRRMDKDEIDSLLLQLRDEGKTFEAIRDYIDEKTGKSTTIGCWWSRYQRIERAQAKSRAVKVARSRLTKFKNKRQSEPLSGHRGSAGDNAEESASKSTSVKRNLHLVPDLSQRPSRAHTAEQHHKKPAFLPAAPQGALETFSEGPLLTPQKLNHTTLRILHSGSYTPLKLRSCHTIRVLFDTVKDLCSLQFAQERVEALKLTFTWMPEGDSSRTMLLKEQYEDSFEVFLETVDEAPCWQSETGKCNVDIEMV